MTSLHCRDVNGNMASSTAKEYGLIKRQGKTVIQPKLSVFDDDSDEDGRGGISKSLEKEAKRIHSKKQLRVDLQTALAEDPTVFQYDDVYEDIVQKQKEQSGWQKRSEEKKPKYIESLLKAAQHRKLEQERVMERKVQREREAEGEEFAGKEAFVTSAYKKKMEEIAALEEKERLEAQLEALTDVTKQKDLSGFYRNLYKQTLGSDVKQESSHNASEGSAGVSDSKSSAIDNKSEEVVKKHRSPELVKSKMQLRRRDCSSSSSSSTSGDDGHQHSEPKSYSVDIVKGRTSSDRHQSVKQSMASSKSDKKQLNNTSDSDSEAPRRHRHFGREDRHDVRRGKRDRSQSTDSSGHSREKRLKESARHSSTSDHRRRRRSVEHSKRKAVLSDEDNKVPSARNISGDDENRGEMQHSKERARDKENKLPPAQYSTSVDLTKPDAADVSQTPALTPREKLLRLFKKRHVGELYENARERYLQRKATQRTIAIVSTET